MTKMVLSILKFVRAFNITFSFNTLYRAPPPVQTLWRARVSCTRSRKRQWQPSYRNHFWTFWPFPMPTFPGWWLGYGWTTTFPQWSTSPSQSGWRVLYMCCVCIVMIAIVVLTCTYLSLHNKFYALCTFWALKVFCFIAGICSRVGHFICMHEFKTDRLGW